MNAILNVSCCVRMDVEILCYVLWEIDGYYLPVELVCMI